MEVNNQPNSLLWATLIEMDFIVKISNLKKIETLHDAHLFNDEDTSKGDVMLADIMTENLLEDAPGFQAGIKCLMSCSSSIHDVLMLKSNVIMGGDDFWIATVSGVGHNMLTGAQPLLHFGTKDVEVRPTAALKWASKRHNPTSLDADTNLIAQARPIEFVWVPFLVERKLLKDFEVYTINRN